MPAWLAEVTCRQPARTIAKRIADACRLTHVVVFIIVPSCLLRLARRHSTGSVPPVNPRQEEGGNVEEAGGVLDPGRGQGGVSTAIMRSGNVQVFRYWTAGQRMAASTLQSPDRKSVV